MEDQNYLENNRLSYTSG